jgi:hypothetical protein
LQPAVFDRNGNAKKGKLPPFSVRVFQDKAAGGDLLQPVIVDRNSHTSKPHKDEGLPGWGGHLG